jgi:hypothetical protein
LVHCDAVNPVASDGNGALLHGRWDCHHRRRRLLADIRNGDLCSGRHIRDDRRPDRRRYEGRTRRDLHYDAVRPVEHHYRDRFSARDRQRQRHTESCRVFAGHYDDSARHNDDIDICSERCTWRRREHCPPAWCIAWRWIRPPPRCRRWLVHLLQETEACSVASEHTRAAKRLVVHVWTHRRLSGRAVRTRGGKGPRAEDREAASSRRRIGAVIPWPGRMIRTVSSPFVGGIMAHSDAQHWGTLAAGNRTCWKGF